MTRLLPLLALGLLTACGAETPADAPTANTSASANTAEEIPPEPLPDKVRIRLETEQGPILVELDARRAPITTANFVAYVDEKRFDGTTFYRASRTKGAPGEGFIQGGIRRNYTRMLPPVAHEPTSKTGIKHGPGTISMAHSENGTGAMGDFFITVSAMPSLDAKGDKPGYAAFGRVVEGMDTVRRILAAETVPNAGRGAMKGQMITKPVKIVSARRVES